MNSTLQADYKYDSDSDSLTNAWDFMQVEVRIKFYLP